ncbi:MAG: Hsp33 family molecular chaperone HslO [Candidatus Delongbacteria bacterium]|nr:Hsp33 family molecular chaperone HslO [Candidatus Delongbacteria bacterium]
MADRLIKGIAEGQVKFTLADCTDTVKKAAEIHGLSLANISVLGKLLCAGVMIGSDMKTAKSLLTVRVEGDGPSGKVIVTTDSNAKIKGLISDPGSMPVVRDGEPISADKLVLGDGLIHIIKDMGLRTPYTGSTEMKYGNIANDLTYYFASSEQIPTSISLGVLIFPDGTYRKAGGFMVQMMPGYTDESVEAVEKNLRSFPSFTDLLDMGYSLEDIALKMVLKGLHAEVLEEKQPEYRCGCSRKKMLSAVKLLNKEEIEEDLERNGYVEIKCQFCKRNYRFTKEDL